jgi:phenylacetate-CoA ligase
MQIFRITAAQPSLFHIIDGLIVEIEQPDQEGYGNIFVTNLFRKRFPVFRYSLGDIGRLVYKDEQPFLELKSREKKSFSLYESNYSLDDFNEVLNEIEAFQIQLLTNSSLDVEIRFLLVKDSLSAAHKNKFEAQKTEQIQEVLGYQLKHLEVV